MSSHERCFQFFLTAFLGLSLTLSLFPAAGNAQTPQSSILVDIDHREAVSLNGPWHYIVDPYHTGWGSGTIRPGPNGYAENEHPVPGGPLVQYDFSKSPTMNVPGDWNTQEKTLFYYEGLLWYERDFNYRKKPGTQVFLHFGAANYQADVFVNDAYVCGHEGGYTQFECDATDAGINPSLQAFPCDSNENWGLLLPAKNAGPIQSKSATAAGVNPASSSCRNAIVSASFIRRPSAFKSSRRDLNRLDF